MENRKEVSYVITKGENFTTTLSKTETDLTPEMILSGNWRNISFKPYNFNALGLPATTGHLHPMLKVREEYRQIFLEMGCVIYPDLNFFGYHNWKMSFT